MFNPNIFRAYDMRGIYRTDFDADFMRHLGGQVAKHLGGIIVIGHDVRPSSAELVNAVTRGALESGARVIDIGQVSSPQLYWAIRELDAVGGMMVTASHNTDDYNGLKVVERHGADIRIIGGHHLRQVYDGKPYAHRAGGTVTHRDIIPEYARAVAKAAQWQGQEMKLAVDAPAPVQRALEHIAAIAPDHGLAARFDTDGDRIVFFDHGIRIAPDWLFVLLTERLGKAPVVFDLRFSRAVHERLDQLAIGYTVSAVGRPSMTRAMHEFGADFGGEMSGHYYWRQFGGMECPELLLLSIVRIVAESGQTLGELVEPYIRYHKSSEINIPIKDRKAGLAAMRYLKKQYADGTASELDGLTVAYGDWWFNLRLSNTEPVLRLVVEAKEKDLLERKVREIQDSLD